MNYLEFYKNSKRRITEALLSMWAPGQKNIQTYFRQVFEEEPLLVEPVFQGTFPWETDNSKMEDMTEILDEDFINALDSVENQEYRFPKGQNPYKHQVKSWQKLLKENKSIVVTSGTGSGKTECFMVPVLQDLLRQKQKGYTEGVQAIFLYPLNALMSSQQKRMKAWCEAVEPQINFAIYNGKTPENNISKPKRKESLPELITRKDIRENPPQILFTNPTMIEYMMVRQSDQPILEKSKGKLRWILLDETHTYTGSAAAELAMQIRRILDAFEVSVKDVRFAATSATISSDDTETLRKFIAQITGKDEAEITVIDGKRKLPKTEKELPNEIIKLKKDLLEKPVLSATEIGRRFKPDASSEESLEIIQEIGDRYEIPTRVHFFVRSIGGVFVCTNPECKRHKDIRPVLGAFTTQMSTNCSECNSPLIELAFCNSCGNQLLVGEKENTNNYPYSFRLAEKTKDELFEINEEISDNNEFEDEDSEQNQNDWSDLVLGWKVLTKPSNSSNLFSVGIDTESATITAEGNYSECLHNNGNSLCPHCGNNKNGLIHHRTSNSMLSRLLSATLLEQAAPMEHVNKVTLWDGRKYIAFTDNRQGTSKSALAQNTETERITTRALVFHYLSDLKRFNEVKRRELTNEEWALYENLLAFKGQDNDIDNKIKKFEQIRDGNLNPQGISKNITEVANHITGNTKIEPLFKHLIYRNNNEKDLYAKALLIDQFGRRPRRVLSPETMGFIKVTYPNLERSQIPTVFANQGFNQNDWYDYLKICVDFFIRENTHIDVFLYRKYITQKYFSNYIYGPNCDLVSNEERQIKKFPQVRVNNNKVAEKQQRIVLLLLAAMGKTEVENIEDGDIDIINDILRKAWSALITYKLLSPSGTEDENPNHIGYKLDLFNNESKVQLELLDKAWLCPVTNVPMDTIFRGYSPALKGNINAENFARYKVVKEINYPYFPFALKQKKNDKNLLEPTTNQEILNWVEENLQEHKELGLWSNMHERILLNYPVFLAAEHSAQQHKDTLQKIEESFNEGKINILSCSTTMEMGVDIGGISEVVMNNVPPKPANYLQRAGRAGRRNEVRALALTFCSPNPIGTMVVNDPKWAMTHPIAMPLIKLESNTLIQRHLNSFLFSKYVSSILGVDVKTKVGLFFYPDKSNSDENLFNYEEFKNYLNEVLANNIPELFKSFKKLVSGTILETSSLFQVTNNCITLIDQIFFNLDERKKLLEKSKDDFLNTQGYIESSPEIKAIDYQLGQLLGQNLIGYLAEHDFIPSAGIPTGIVDLNIHTASDNRKSEGTENNFYKADPSFHITRALAEYAPGNQVVVNENAYTSAGILLNSQWNDSRRLILQNCRNCGYSGLVYQEMEECPVCGQREFVGIEAVGKHFTQVIEPAGFSVDYFEQPSRIIDKKRNVQTIIEPILLNVKAWEKNSSNSMYDIRPSQSSSEILYYNKGKGYGFAVCIKCGKADKENGGSEDYNDSPLKNHKRLFGGKKENDRLCDGNHNMESGVKRNVLLGGRFQTDFIEIRFKDSNNHFSNDSTLLRSLGVILCQKLTEHLGVNQDEVNFNIKKYGNYSSIYIFDTAKGGAGYSLRFIDYADQILDKAFSALDSCDCEKACEKCLIDRNSQWFMNDLDRYVALEWFRQEKENRVEVPQNIIDNFPEAKRVTLDINSEIIKALGSNEISQAVFFMSDDIINWEPNEWPLIELINRLKLEGKKVDFAVKNPTVEGLNARQLSELIEAKAKFSIKISKVKPISQFVPILQIDYSDKTSKIYFSESIDNVFSGQWGATDSFVYQSYIDSKLDLNEWEINLEDLVSDNQSIFEFKIETRQTNLFDFYRMLTNYEAEKWNKIKEEIKNSQVNILYRDTYLVDPIGSLIVLHLIKDFKSDLNLSINELEFDLSSYDRFGQRSMGRIIDNFISKEERKDFLNKGCDEILEVTPKLKDVGRLPHWRELIFESDNFELIIRPNGGIKNGWVLDRSEQTDDYYEDIDFDDNLSLYNQSFVEGILYNVIFQKK